MGGSQQSPNLLNSNVTSADLLSVEVLFSQEQTARGDYQILLRPKVTESKIKEGKEAERRPL